MPDRASAAAMAPVPSLRLRKRRLGLLACALIALFCADLLTGSAPIGPSALWRAFAAPDTTVAVIVWQIRLPQALMALMAGAALGLAGAEMQTVLENPLASPFTLGISSAAALGAALALVLGLSLPWVPTAYVVAANAFVFALLCTVLLDLAARRARIGASGIVLLGIALVFAFNAALSLVQVVASAAALQDLTFWMMGSLARSGWPELGLVALALLIVSPCSWRSAWQLTALRFGDERAASFGVNTRRLRRAALLRISALAAVAVSLTGIIGFIGLVAPHIARHIWGEDHRWYLPASALTGSAILLAASIASKSIAPGMVIPIGIVTTLVGVPFFCVAVLRRKRWQ